MPRWLFSLSILVVLPLVLQELHECSPWLAHKVLKRAVAMLPEQDRDNYQREWAAELASVPGKLTKLVRAAGLVIAALRMRAPLRDPRQTAIRRQQHAGMVGRLGMDAFGGASASLRRSTAIAMVMAASLTTGLVWYQFRSQPQTPSATELQLAQLSDQRNMLVTQIDQVSTELARRQDLARLECNGTPGSGLTGRAGEGPNCRRNRAEADRFREDSNLDEMQATLSNIDSLIVRLASD